MSTGNVTTDDKKSADLAKIIADLRIALAGVPEVAKLYGKPEESPNSYDAPDLRGDVGEMKDAYSSPELDEAEEEADEIGSTKQPKSEYTFSVGDKKEQPEGSPYSKVVSQEESKESESENYTADFKLPLKKESESKEGEEEKLTYVENLDLNVQPPQQRHPEQPVVVPVDLASNYEKVRKETDHRLARLARFLPDKVREGLDKKFADAVNLARPQSDEAYKAATEVLKKLQASLDSKAPELRTTEANFLRKQIQATLDRDGSTLEADDRKDFAAKLAGLEKNLPPNEEEAKQQLGSLQELADQLDEAIYSRLRSISDLCVDFERLTPIVDRALSIENDKKADLEKANSEIKDGFAGQFVKDGLKIEEIRSKVSALEEKVREAFKDFTVDDALEEQKNSLPASPGSLKVKGDKLGSGAFGAVYELKNDGDGKLVGKSFDGDNLEAKKEMEHEAEIYARIGEHTNIAKCYGIQEVEGKSMLVMDKIEGQDVEKVFKDLHKRLKKGKIKREEYLAATQHIIKGTLMGLAHMEAMGLVHKDIKGDNVKFDTRTNQAVLIDMGLAQPEGEHQNPKNYFLIAPPEQIAGRKDKHDEVVTNLWDSFTVGKLLFEEMEREGDGAKNLLVTGGAPIKQDITMPSMQGLVQPIVQGSRAALKRGVSGELEAQVNAKGELVGQALKKADTPDEGGKAGKYGAETQYVDFMNRLTHPDPKQRMSTSEALKHPFMTDTFMSGEELDKVFGIATSRQKSSGEDESGEDSGEEEKGPRIDTDALAEAYKKGEKKQDYESLLSASTENESEEESKGPRIDTDALANAYKKGEEKKYDPLLGEGHEEQSEEVSPRQFTKQELDEAYFGKRGKKGEESELEFEDEEKGPRIDTDALAEAYSKGKKQQYDPLTGEEQESDEEKS